MEFECFDFENPRNVEKTEEEKRAERIQTSFITIQQASLLENRLIKEEDLKKRQQKRTQCGDSQSEEDEEDYSKYLLEDEILLDLDFFNKKGDENIDKCIMEKVSIWNDVRPVIQVIAKDNRIEIIYDNGHRLLKDFQFLIKKLEQYKENNDAKLAWQLLQEHQKSIEHQEQLLERITHYYDHEMNVLFDKIARNYEKSKQMAYDIIDSQDQTTYFAFSIRKLNCEGGIQHLSGPFGYSKPLINVFGGDIETYIRFIMRKGVIEHFDRQSHFLIFLMKLKLVNKTDLNVITLDNIKIPISVTLERHSLSRIQIMPDCFNEDYLKMYKIQIKTEILEQLLEMRRSKEQFQNTIQGLEDFEYFMQSQIFYDKFYKKQRYSSDSSKMCHYRYLDRLQSNRYLTKSQRRNYEQYLSLYSSSFKRKKNINNTVHDSNIDHSVFPDHFHHDISIDSQTIKQEEIYQEQEDQVLASSQMQHSENNQNGKQLSPSNKQQIRTKVINQQSKILQESPKQSSKIDKSSSKQPGILEKKISKNQNTKPKQSNKFNQILGSTEPGMSE